jgi:hypothetical protein
LSTEYADPGLGLVILKGGAAACVSSGAAAPLVV